MKKIFLLSALALLSAVGCTEKEAVPQNRTEDLRELAVIPMNGDNASHMTKGYVEETTFVETYYSSLHAGEKVTAPRTMQLSAYLTPQDGEPQNYFVNKTYSQSTKSETTWWNTNTVGGDHDPIYWPIGGALDFLAYSISSEETGAGKSRNIKAVWDSSNASKKVTLTIPGENTQNDILFASAANIKSSDKKSVDMEFCHAQAWLEFALTGSVTDASAPGGADQPIVNVKRIELENVYNAGTLTISNNGGNAVAKWDFTREDRQNISVDNFNENLKLTSSPKYLDMLIPQQTKADIVLYYTLGSDSKVLSYRFTSDNKTWLMGEKYVYTINISTSEITVEPVVSEWVPLLVFNYTVKTPATPVKDGETVLGTVTASDFFPSGSFTIEGGPAEDGSATYTCDTWGAQVTLTATPVAEGYYFKEWSDGVTENPRTFAITEDVELPGATFTEIPEATITIATEYLKIILNGEETNELSVAQGTDVTVEIVPVMTSMFRFVKWKDNGSTALERTVKVTEDLILNPEIKTVDYVEIEGVKWATQNLAITESGKRCWALSKYDNDHIFVNGDYFQWAASYEGYGLEGEDAKPENLLIYDSFINTACGGGEPGSVFKTGKKFYWDSSPFYDVGSMKFTKYNNGPDLTEELEITDDVANIIKGDNWHTPSISEFQALCENTEQEWDFNDLGVYIYNKDESNKIKYNALLFLSAGGVGYQDSILGEGYVGDYWSNCSQSDIGYHLEFMYNEESSSLSFDTTFSSRFFGYSVRPVIPAVID